MPVTTRRHHPEQEIQKVVFEHYRVRRARDAVMFAVPNGGWRSRVEASIMKGTGTLAGAPDIVAVKGGQFHGLELKAPGRKP